MGWLLNLVQMARRTKFKCSKCGYEEVSFIGSLGRMFIQCNGCQMRQEITREEWQAITNPKAVHELPSTKGKTES